MGHPLSLESLLASDASIVGNDWGKTVTRYPEGDSGSGASVGASAWVYEGAEQEQNESGERYMHRGTLTVLSSQTVHKDDAWLIDSVEWQTVVVHDVVGGLRDLSLRRTDKYRTKQETRII